MKSRAILLNVLPVFMGFFIMGFCDIVGITSDYVQSHFGWSAAVTGFVPSMVFVWFLFLGIPVGNLMNRLGRKNTVLISMAITVVGMMLPLVVYNGAVCMASFALLGIGNAVLQVSLNPLLVMMLNDRRLQASALTAGQVVKALSSLLGPEVVMLSVAWFGSERWYYCFPLLGAVTLLSAIWLMATNTGREDIERHDGSIRDAFGLLADSVILKLFAGILFIVALDVAMNFISSKLMAMRFGWEEADAKYAPQVYFLCRTVGGFLSAFLLMRIHSVKYFRINMLAAVAALLLLMAVSHAVVDMALIGLVGFFCSSVFSIIYSLALNRRPENANQISGLMITAISGGAIATPLVGVSIEYVGIEAGVGVILLCAVYLGYCAFTSRHNADSC